MLWPGASAPGRDELAHAPRARRRWKLRLCFAVALAPILASACSSDSPVAAAGAIPALLERVSGDRQIAPPGEQLARPLVVRILDTDGRPVRRVEVRWSATSGTITPTVALTDINGVASATWRLGTSPGEHTVRAEADGVAPTSYVAVVDPDASPLPDPLRSLALTTYDGSGQVVHPDYARLTGEFPLGTHALVITPYPYGNANFENPSLFAGDGRDRWNVPATVTNPVARPEGGYLSDPDMVYSSDARLLRVYYRQVTAANEILMIESADGARWTPPKLVARAPNHSIVSPAIVRRATDDWWMWSVNSGASGCGSATTSVEVRRSRDGIEWSAPRVVELVQAGGLFPWHIEVQ